MSCPAFHSKFRCAHSSAFTLLPYCSLSVAYSLASLMYTHSVFYFPDTISAESVGGKVYGNPVVETPWFDTLAARGTTFAQCHVLHTQCAPSRHAMLTGRYLHTTGHRTQDHGVEPWEPDLFKALHEAGYYINWYAACPPAPQHAHCACPMCSLSLIFCVVVLLCFAGLPQVRQERRSRGKFLAGAEQ